MWKNNWQISFGLKRINVLYQQPRTNIKLYVLLPCFPGIQNSDDVNSEGELIKALCTAIVKLVFIFNPFL